MVCDDLEESCKPKGVHTCVPCTQRAGSFTSERSGPSAERRRALLTPAVSARRFGLLNDHDAGPPISCGE
jgi:hypothetical protein